VPQRLVDHHRSEVRAPDSDVDDGADPLTGGTGPLAAAQPVGEIAHRVEHRVDVLDYVLPVHYQRGVARKSQCGVQHRAILRDVDVYAGEHLVATLLELGGAG
jgi:hypothetical protein